MPMYNGDPYRVRDDPDEVRAAVGRPGDKEAAALYAKYGDGGPPAYLEEAALAAYIAEMKSISAEIDQRITQLEETDEVCSLDHDTPAAGKFHALRAVLNLLHPVLTDLNHPRTVPPAELDSYSIPLWSTYREQRNHAVRTANAKRDERDATQIP